MGRALRTFLKTLFTGKDNTSADLGRVLWGLCTVWFLIVETYAVLRLGAAIAPVEISGALAALGVGHGASLWMKSSSEPEEK